MYRKKCLEEYKQQKGYIFNPDNKISQDIELAVDLRARNFKLVYVVNNVRHLKILTPFNYLVHKFHRGAGICSLYLLKSSDKKIEFGPGLLWDDYARKYPVKKWAVIFWKRIFGPFDYKSFWAGEKTKAAGFLYQFFLHKFKIK